MFSSSLFLVILAVLSSSSLQREDDICSYQVRRRYLELGESGAVTAQNVTYNSSFSNVTARERCLLEIITCPSCVVNLIFRHLNLTQHCEIGNSLSNSLCRFVSIINLKIFLTTISILFIYFVNLVSFLDVIIFGSRSRLTRRCQEYHSAALFRRNPPSLPATF